MVMLLPVEECKDQAGSRSGAAVANDPGWSPQCS